MCNMKPAMSSRTRLISEKETAECYVKTRYVVVLMMSLGVMNVSFLRNGISVAILEMVDEFDWTITQQTTVLGCYFYGFMLMNIPGALLSKRYGIRKVVGYTFLLSSVLTLLIPIFARKSFGLLVATRSAIGFLHGALFPAVMTGLGDWAPPVERSRLLSISFGSGALGGALVFPLAGVIVSSFRWETVFFITGGAALLWSILWLILIHDTPATHPRISENERRYIKESIGTKEEDKKRKIPWLKICTSPPVLGAIAAQLGHFWATSVFVSFGPMYMARVLQFDVKSAGFLSSLPFFLRFFTAIVWGFVADWMISTKFVPLLWVRKFSSTFPAIVSSLSLIAVAYLGHNKWLVVMLLATSVGFFGMGSSGHRSSFIDIAPAFGGVIFSLSNTLTAADQFLALQISGVLLVDNSLHSWRNVFLLAAAVSFAGGIAYAVLASDQVQEWAREPTLARGDESMSMNENYKATSWSSNDEKEKPMLDVVAKKV